jgi:hypothetical protein
MTFPLDTPGPLLAFDELSEQPIGQIAAASSVTDEFLSRQHSMRVKIRTTVSRQGRCQACKNQRKSPMGESLRFLVEIGQMRSLSQKQPSNS